MRVKWQWLSISLFFVLVVCGLTACNRERGVNAARDDQPASVSPAEQDFMMKAAQANLSEIDLALLALQKSDNSGVRDYANMIQSDHKRSLDGLADLMKDNNVPQPQAVAAETQKEISRMNNLTGPEFDREWVNMMVIDHRNALELFRDQQASAQNPDVKEYVEDVLPKLEMHFDKAQRLQSKVFSAPNTPQNKSGPTSR